MSQISHLRLSLRQAVISVFVMSGLVSTLHAGLNLTPQREKFDQDGVAMWQLSFDTGTNKKASYRPPADWFYSGGTSHLDLRPADKSQFQATIAQEHPQKVIPFDNEGRKALLEQTLSSLPEGSEEAKIETQAMNPLQISGKDTYLIELSYTYYGVRFSRYCLFLNLKQGRLRFQLTCRDSDYKVFSKAFQKSLYSWQNI
jgi:hypothetical protein